MLLAEAHLLQVSGIAIRAGDCGHSEPVEETLPAEWEQVDALCLPNLRRSILLPSAIDLRPGEIVTCDFFNLQVGGQSFSLDLDKSLAPGQAAEVSNGADVAYQISVTNTSTFPVLHLLVTEQIPEGLALSPADTNGWTLSGDGRSATQTIGRLEQGQGIVLPILMRVVTQDPGAIVNVVSVSGGSNGDSGAPLPDYTMESEAEIMVKRPTALDPGDEPTVLPRLYLPHVYTVSFRRRDTEKRLCVPARDLCVSVAILFFSPTPPFEYNSAHEPGPHPQLFDYCPH